MFREDEISDQRQCVGIFALDDQFDRLILNPTVVNRRMFSINTYTKRLSHGCLLCLLHVPRGEIARFSADHLGEFYYTMGVTPEQAKRNTIGMKFDASELSALN